MNAFSILMSFPRNDDQRWRLCVRILLKNKRRILRIMVQNISKAFNKHGVQYWLDYGTLLGAYRTGDILRHDHDADISLLLSSDPGEAFRDLAKIGIVANGLVAKLGPVSLDFVRWKPVNTTIHGKTEVMLHKFYPSWVKDNMVVRYHHKLETFPQSWVIPSQKIKFQGVDVAVPNPPERLLSFRYPYTFGTFGVQFPYKWKCWVPCLLRKSVGC
ncbi:unnamed protein product [Porites lobata]|uniref:LicD/FKTN/FKRP nucleotidyltransferase domain-containing protein n=1 Tax=Porites lobata TaxID=104759 RepID=A0ABN8PLG0_9CNID|nr:unnamed protein product [Porites lobata]